MKLQEYITATENKISEGCDYQWNCFGMKPFMITTYFENANTEATAIYDRKTLDVFSVEFLDNDSNTIYRYLDHKYKDAYYAECESRGIDPKNEFDLFKIREVIVEADILNKINCSALGDEYDTRIKVPLDLPDPLLFDLMKLAHEKDVTLNELITGAIASSIERYEN